MYCIKIRAGTTYKATNCAVKISHSLARPDPDHKGQSMEDNQIRTSPYSNQVKLQTQKDQTCIETSETGKKDISTVGEEEEQNKKPPDLPNEVADL
jgi:hypothetical protein